LQRRILKFFCSQVGLCNSKKFFTYQGKISRVGIKREELENEIEADEDEEDEDEEYFESFEEEQSAGCQVCQLVVTYVEQLVGNNNTVQEIVAKVEELCAQLGPLKAPCDQMDQQYVPQLVKWILNKENPQAFCSQVGLC